MSRDQQDLSKTARLRCGVYLSRLADLQLAADRDHQFAIADGLGNELKSFRIRCRNRRQHHHGWVILGIPGAPRTDANTPPGLTLAINFSAVLP